MTFAMPDLLCSLARIHGDRVALVSGPRRATYAELPRRAVAFAAAFAALGLHPGDKVGLALRDGFDTLDALFGIWRLGAVAVPMDHRSRGPEREQFAAEFGLSTILEDRAYPGVGYISTDWQGTVVPAAEARMDQTLPQAEPSALALISLTSGTTGRPLGILIDHASLISRAFGYGMEGGYPTGARYLNVYPLSFSASRNHTIGHLLRGGTVIFRPALFGASELIDWTLTEQATFLFAVGATVRQMLDVAGGGEGAVFPDLKMLYSGGSGMATEDKSAAARRLSPNFLHCFSATLTGTCSILTGADLLARPETDGRLVPQSRIEVVDEDDNALPFGATGILRARTAGMASGFYADRDRAQGDRIRAGWAYTGDLAHLSADGFLTVVGRTSDLIIRGGANVYPAEVEAVLTALAGITDAAVVGVPHHILGEEIAAFVVTDGTIPEEAIRAACVANLSSDKRPRHIILCPELPRNANGKVLKRDLRDRMAGAVPITEHRRTT
jgi:long-chain acyl-CoA synthetase